MATEKVQVQITADGSQVPREADKVKKSIAGIGKEGDALAQSFSKIGGILAGAFSVGAFTAFLFKVNQAADQLNDLSTRLGASASGLQSLQMAAQQAGGSAEAMATGLSKLQVTIGEGLQGNKKAAEAFQQLGLSARELAGLKTDEAMRRVAVALSEVENANVRAQVGTDLLGKGFKENAGFFADAANQLNEVNEALAAAGATLDDLDVAKIGIMNDELALQGTIVQNLGTKFLANLSPAVSVAVDSFANLMTNMGGATEAGKGFGVVMVGAIKLVEAGVYSLAAVFETLRATVAVILAAITNAVGNLIGILARAAEIADLDIAERLRAASDATLRLGASFANVAAAAWDNAKAAGTAAIASGMDMLRASEIFAAASDAALAKAEQAVKRTQDIQNAAMGAGGEVDQSKRAWAMATPMDSMKGVDKQLAQFDPLKDPRVLQEMEINSTLQALKDQHDATMLGKVEAFNQTTLGAMLSYGQQQIDFEQSKAQIMGGLANTLISTAMQAGGRIGKFGKALAIAQTIWSTASAAIQSYEKAGGYPWGIAPAAAMVAIGMAQLANIQKTNIGSGGGIVGARGGGATLTTPSLNDNVTGAQQQESRGITQVVIQGNVFSSQETADWIIEQIREAVESRDVVFISGNSRQAMEFAT